MKLDCKSMYLGIDLGTTGLKCVLYDKDGGTVCEYNEEYPLIFNGSFVEQDADLWWKNTVEAVRYVTEKSGIRSVKALSISTQAISFVPVDKCGNPLCNSINWLDMRATEENSEILSRFGEDVIYEKTGKPCDAAYSLPKIMWLKKHSPEIYDAADKILFPLDFLNMKLCGEAVCDYTVAGGTMMYNIKEKCWDKDIINAFGIDIEKLPRVACMGEPVGEVLESVCDEMGIERGCLVVLGGQDQKLAAIGAGLRPGVCTMSFGTAGAVTVASEKMAEKSPIPQFRFDEKYFVSEGVAETAGAALKWLCGIMGNLSYREMDALAEKSRPNANGVTAQTDYSTGAAFSGMTLSTTKGDMIYALYEGVCREIAERLSHMEKVKEIRVFGGGSKSRIWCEILSRVTGCRVAVLDSPETASRGAAILASGGRMSPCAVKEIIEIK